MTRTPPPHDHSIEGNLSRAYSGSPDGPDPQECRALLDGLRLALARVAAPQDGCRHRS